MKQITQLEFEGYVEALIEGKISKVKLAKQLETDVRTLDNKIQELSAINPKLYERYIKKLPYKQKEYTHIDFEALLIYTLKQDLPVEEAANKYGISRRTFQRKINEMENRELVELYKRVADNRKHSRKNGIDIVRKIDALEEKTIVIGGINDRRKAELLDIERRFNKLCETMNKTEAARQMGYKDRDRIYKLLNELYRLEIEEHTISTSNGTFKENLKVGLPSNVTRKQSANKRNTGEEKSINDER